MAEALAALLAGQGVVSSKLPKVGRSGAWKHQSSPAFVRLAQEMRMAGRMAKSIREGWKVRQLMIGRREEIKGLGIELPYLADGGGGLGRKGWLGYAGLLEQRVRTLKSKMHGDLREEMKTQKVGREAKLTK